MTAPETYLRAARCPAGLKPQKFGPWEIARLEPKIGRRLGIPAATNDSDRQGTFNWGWPMFDIKKVPGFTCRGAQGLWNVPDAVAEEIT